MQEITSKKAGREPGEISHEVREHLVELVEEHMNDLSVPPPPALTMLMEEILLLSPMLQTFLAEAAMITPLATQDEGETSK